MREVDVLIAGGGISGLATAWWLARSGLRVELWERAGQAGGKIHTGKTGGYTIEQAAALVLNYRPEVTRLMAESGLAIYKVTPRSARRYLLHRGRLLPVPARIGEMLTSALWSWRAKLRLLAEPLIPEGGHDDETVSEFITRRLGREPLEKAMDPYVAGTLASDPDLASAAAVLPRLTALEHRYGSLAVGVLATRIARRRRGCPSESFSFAGGMSTLIEALVRAPGLRLRLGCAVTAFARDGADGWSVAGASAQGTRHLHARHVVLSVPADAAASLLQPLDAALARLLLGIQYAPVCVIHLGFERSAVRHPLDGVGFLAPREARLPLNGVLWMSTLFPERAPPGKALLTCYLGGARAPQVIDWDDARCVATALAGLERLLGFSTDPEMMQIHRHERALPLYHGAYVARGREISLRLARLPGLHLAANYLGGVSVRDRIVCGCATANRVRHAIDPMPAGTTRPGRADLRWAAS